MSDEIDETLEKLEVEVMESLDTPYSTYRVEFPYTCSFTIPDDGHDTRVTIDSRSEVLRYGKNEEDIQLQMQLDLEQGTSTYSKHLIKWVNERLWDIDPREVDVTYGENITVEPMTNDQIEEFKEDCLDEN